MSNHVKLVPTIGHGSNAKIKTAVFSFDNQFVATGDETKVVLWDKASGREIRQFVKQQEHPVPLRFQEDGTFELHSRRKSTVKKNVFDYEQKTALVTKETRLFWDVFVTRDNFLSEDGEPDSHHGYHANESPETSFDAHVYGAFRPEFTPKNGEKLYNLHGRIPAKQITSLSISKDNRYILTASPAEIIIFDMEMGVQLWQILVPTKSNKELRNRRRRLVAGSRFDIHRDRIIGIAAFSKTDSTTIYFQTYSNTTFKIENWALSLPKMNGENNIGQFHFSKATFYGRV